MELELKQTSLDVYETGSELNLTQEAAAETIVPDYCPDIARIIKAEGKVFLHSRELRSGKAEVAGTVRVSVLYTPEGEGGIRALDFAVPFSAESDHRGFQNCRYLAAEASIENLETRMLNPRKVSTRCTLRLNLTGYRKITRNLCGDVGGEGAQVEKKKEIQRAIFLTAVSEKDFTFTDKVMLSPGGEGMAELLSSRVRPVVTESRLLGRKLIFKGNFSVSLLYRDRQGTCRSVSAELPFSQIMEIETEDESAAADLRLQLTGMDLQSDGNDPEGREIDLTLYFHASALLRREEEAELLTDLYSTAFEVAYDAAPVEFTAFREILNRRQTVRELLEIGVAAESILSAAADCGCVTVSRDGTLATLRTSVRVSVLYLDEGGVPLLTQRRLDVSCQLELPEGCRVSGWADCLEEIQASPSDRGIEVRFPVDFRIEAVGKVQKACITAAKLNREAPKNTTGTPSLVLRCLGRQESAWELAKSCNTTVADILTANQLEREEDIPTDRLLLIPRKRA